MWAGLLLCALSAGEPSFQAPLDVQGWHFAGFPLASYGSDVGLTLGAGVFLYRALPGRDDEYDRLDLSVSYATRGPAAVDSSLDLRRLFGTSLRTSWNVHAGDDDRMPYWGEGAQLGGLPTPPGYGTPPEPYRYHDRRVFLSAVLRGALLGPLGWHARARFVDVDVATQGPLLAASQPPGARGGRVALAELGLLYDTRDREVGTHRGVFATAAAFAAPLLQGVSDFAFHGYDVGVRLYLPLWSGATLALRGLYDRKLGGVPGLSAQRDDIPFFERTMYEGLTFNEGLGGAGTVRGIARYRLAGDEKMLANAQLRVNLIALHLFRKTQEIGFSAGLDAGRARQPGYAAVEALGAAVGLRLVWDRAIVLRVDMGRTRGGDSTLYVSFGEQF